jgi:hypothetical protein
MPFSLESLAALATIIGTALSILPLLHSRNWIVLTSLPLVCLVIVGGLYARRDRRAIKSTPVTIEGQSIDCLNVANMRRRVNRTLGVQEAEHTARIEGEDLKIEWIYSGYCRAKHESVMEFSIEAERTVPFDRLECVAYDLGHDPSMAHKIRPLLIGTDGVSKKISVPFLEPLSRKQPFRVMLKCTLPGCIQPGFGYYVATLSFAQDRVRRSTIRLIFSGSAPVWVRVYECAPSRTPTLLKTLAALREEHGEYEYMDVVEGADGQSARVYAFWRDSI